MIAELVARGHRVDCVVADGLADVVAETGARVAGYHSVLAGMGPTGGGDSPPFELFAREGAAMAEAARAITATGAAHARPGVPGPDLVVYEQLAARTGRLLAAEWGCRAAQLVPVFASNEQFSLAERMMATAGVTAGAPAVRPPRPVVEDLNVVFLPREFQLAEETFDERFAFVGPSVGRRAFLGAWTPPAAGVPVVLISLGTMFNGRPDFFRACAEAFTGTPWHAVISVGQRVDPADLGPVPPNVEVRRWVPHLDVLDHAQVFLTHGGVGSVMESLYAGVPMVVAQHPLDRQLTGARVAELGLGRLLPPEEVSAGSVYAAVTEVAADTATRARVQEMRRRARAAGGAPRAADVIEAHIGRAD
ncbi:macrolide family glycosyltransferase [Actinokineospora sp. 24-640]